MKNLLILLVIAAASSLGCDTMKTGDSSVVPTTRNSGASTTGNAGDRPTSLPSSGSTLERNHNIPMSGTAVDRTNDSATTGSSVARDNTSVNARDRNDATKTPIDQNENQSDINITAEVRKRVVDSQMSTYAKNVKIITQNGQITLRGPVKNADEKKTIEEIARAVAGDKVDSQLEVE